MEKIKVTLSIVLPHIISATILLVTSLIFKINSLEFSRFDIFISSLIGTIVTILGFLITIIAIILGLIQTRIVKYISSNDTYNLLSKSFLSPILEGTLLVIVCFYISTIIKIDNSYILKGWILYILQFILVAFVIDIIKICWVLVSIFKEVSKEAGEEYKPNSKDVEEGKEQDFINNNDEHVS
ncbi:hypothetical protein [Vallitalea guaymasensis]|uniref:hypothetical protein n=1 Tax=Vallitalea guaymasensis TaxID=1185412 RepID=UPI000DE25843|nr:hypothetical protein [Vallitalea guaymasensis]